MVAAVTKRDPEEWVRLISREIENFWFWTSCDVDFLLLIDSGQLFLFLADEESEAEFLETLRRLASAPENGLSDRSRKILRRKINEIERRT